MGLSPSRPEAATISSVRPARPDDFDAIADITNHYIRDTAVHFGYEPVTGAELATAWRDGIHPWCVVEYQGAVAGYAKAALWRERGAYARTVETGLYIAPERQGLGLGRRVYSALLDEVSERGFHTVVAAITLPNAASIALHRSLGFTVVGVFREVGWKLDQWRDVEWWQKLLG